MRTCDLNTSASRRGFDGRFPVQHRTTAMHPQVELDVLGQAPGDKHSRPTCPPLGREGAGVCSAELPQTCLGEGRAPLSAPRRDSAALHRGEMPPRPAVPSQKDICAATRKQESGSWQTRARSRFSSCQFSGVSL